MRKWILLPLILCLTACGEHKTTSTIDSSYYNKIVEEALNNFKTDNIDKYTADELNKLKEKIESKDNYEVDITDQVQPLINYLDNNLIGQYMEEKYKDFFDNGYNNEVDVNLDELGIQYDPDSNKHMDTCNILASDIYDFITDNDVYRSLDWTENKEALHKLYDIDKLYLSLPKRYRNLVEGREALNYALNTVGGNIDTNFDVDKYIENIDNEPESGDEELNTLEVKSGSPSSEETTQETTQETSQEIDTQESATQEQESEEDKSYQKIDNHFYGAVIDNGDPDNLSIDNEKLKQLIADSLDYVEYKDGRFIADLSNMKDDYSNQFVSGIYNLKLEKYERKPIKIKSFVYWDNNTFEIGLTSYFGDFNKKLEGRIQPNGDITLLNLEDFIGEDSMYNVESNMLQ